MKCDRQVMEEMQGYLEEAEEAIESAENWATAAALNNILKVVQFLLDNVEYAVTPNNEVTPEYRTVKE